MYLLSNKWHLNSKGFSILQVMLASVVMSIIAIGTVSLLQNSLFVQNNLRQVSDFQLLSSEIALVLNNPTACPLAFSGGTYPSTSPTVVNGTSANVPTLALNSTEVLSPGAPVPNTSLTIQSMSLSNITIVSGISYGYLNVTAQKANVAPNASAIGGSIITKQFWIQMTLTATKNVKTCFASSILTPTFLSNFCQNVLNPRGHWTGTECIVGPPICQPNQLLGTDDNKNLVCWNVNCLVGPTGFYALPISYTNDPVSLTNSSCYLSQAPP